MLLDFHDITSLATRSLRTRSYLRDTPITPGDGLIGSTLTLDIPGASRTYAISSGTEVLAGSPSCPSRSNQSYRTSKAPELQSDSDRSQRERAAPANPGGESTVQSNRIAADRSSPYIEPHRGRKVKSPYIEPHRGRKARVPYNRAASRPTGPHHTSSRIAAER